MAANISQDIMQGWLSDTAVGRFVSGTAKIITAPIRGTGHMVMETYRGVKSGDLKRILAAPIKGGFHFIGESYRGTADTAQIGVPVLTIAGSIPSPASPFLLGGATGLAVLSKIRQKQLARQALSKSEVDFIQEQVSRGNVEFVSMDEYNQGQTGARPQTAAKPALIAAGLAAAGAFIFLIAS